MISIGILFRDKRGAAAIEYALLAALIGVGAIAAMRGVGTSVQGTLNNAAASVGQGKKTGDSFNVL